VVSSTLATTFSHNSFTIEWWINPSSVACCNNQISLNGATWTDFVSHMGWNNDMYIGSNSNGDRFQTASNSVDVGAWQSYTYTFENGPTTATAKLYKNGVLIESANSWANNSNTISSIQFGVGGSNSIAGKMSSIRIYNKALTNSEVIQNYNAFESRFGLSNVTIGSQVWTNKNLDVTTYRNGDPIPQVTDASTWASLTTGAWCYYNDDPANGVIYGKLYNWYAVNDARGLAPAGWHIPTKSEWETLYTATTGGSMKTTGITRWNTPNTSATNESGFAGLPGGLRHGTNVAGNGSFGYIGDYGFWWSKTASSLTEAWDPTLTFNGSGILDYTARKDFGLSVRLIKD
jgi:uncharacterized protein (TIGR02145 family)